MRKILKRFSENLLNLTMSPCRLIISRPGQSLRLLNKQLRHYLINFKKIIKWSFSPTSLRRRYAQTVEDNSSSYAIDYIIMKKNFLNPEGHRNCIIGSKVMAVWLNGWIFPIGGVASGWVCACSLSSRLLFHLIWVICLL